MGSKYSGKEKQSPVLKLAALINVLLPNILISETIRWVVHIQAWLKFKYHLIGVVPDSRQVQTAYNSPRNLVPLRCDAEPDSRF